MSKLEIMMKCNLQRQISNFEINPEKQTIKMMQSRFSANARFADMVVDNSDVLRNLAVTGKLKVDTIKEKTDKGVNVEGVVIKDGGIGVPKTEIKEKLDEEIMAVEGSIAIGECFIEEHALRMVDPVVAESKFTFVGPVYFRDEVHGINAIKPIKQCLVCMHESQDEHRIVGFEWNGGSICMQCILDTALHYRAQQSWQEKNGDPFKNCTKLIDDCMDVISKLQAQVRNLEERLGELETTGVNGMDEN